MSKLSFTTQAARRLPIKPMPDKYKESRIRPNIEEGDGIRPHMPLVPLRFLDTKYQDVTTEQYVVIPKGRIVSAITVQNETTGDILNISNVVPVTNEVIGTGDGSTTNFTGTLAQFPVNAGSVQINDDTEIFTDPAKDGVLVGDQGGSGTIDYATGAYDVTFNAAVTNAEDFYATYTYQPEGDIPVGQVDQTDGVTPLYIGADDSYYGYTRDIAGLIVPANGGVSRTITYDASDVAAGVPKGDGSVVSVGGTYVLPANAPIGVAFQDIYQDIRGSFINYELWKSYGVVSEQHIKLPFVDFGLLRSLNTGVAFVNEDAGATLSGYKVGAATMSATLDAGYIAAENKYSFMYFDSEANGTAGLAGQLLVSDLFGNWVPKGAAVDNSDNISLDSPRTGQVVGRILFADTRFPRDLMETVEVPYGQRVAGTGTEGLTENLYDFIVTVLNAGGYAFGTTDPAKVAKDLVQQGAFGYMHIQLTAR